MDEAALEEPLYRAMTEEDGAPALGASARKLGARLDIDIEPDGAGLVHPDAGGMSVSPESPRNLPRHRRPPEWGGNGADPVWEISSQSLGPELTYRADPDLPDEHGFIEPIEPMSFDEYQDALAATRNDWRLAVP
jgi:hypothetical protein